MSEAGVSTVTGGPAAGDGLPQEIRRVVVVDGVRKVATYRLWWVRRLGDGELTDHPLG